LYFLGAGTDPLSRDFSTSTKSGPVHAVALRALPDYDALFGVDFTHHDTKASSQ